VRDKALAVAIVQGVIDTLKVYENLKSAQLSDSRARAIAQVIEDSLEASQLQQMKLLAEKLDTGRFGAEMQGTEAAIKETELRLRSDLGGKIADAKTALLRLMFIYWIAQVAATLAIIFSAIKLMK
jgi:hypothetical protein